MTRSMKILFLVFTAFFLNACGASVNSRGDATAEAAKRAELDLNREMRANAEEATTPPPATATAVAPMQKPQQANRFAQQQQVPMMAPMVQQPAYMTPQSWAYPAGGNDLIARKVAVFDSSRKDCNGGCIRFAVTTNSGLPAYIEKASALSITIDGMPWQIDYYGTRVGRANGDYRFANGKVAPSIVGDLRTPPLFIAPAIKDINQGIRIRLDDPGEHSVRICFYYEGAKEVQTGQGIMAVPYHYITECLLYRVKYDRTYYWFQEGRPS